MGCLIWSHRISNENVSLSLVACAVQAAMMIVFCGIRGRLVFYHQIIIVIIIATHRGTYICMYTWWWICWYYSIYIMCPWKSWIPIWSWRLIKMYMYIIKLYPRQNECPLGNQFVLILLLDTSHTKPMRISRHSRLGLLIRLLWFDIRAAKWAPNTFMM